MKRFSQQEIDKLQRKYDKFIQLIYANTEITENQSVS